MPSRSRGTSMRSGPSSVSTVLPLAPLRWLLGVLGLGRPGPVAQVMRQLGTQGTLDQRLLERHRGGIDRLRAHRPGHELVNEFLGDRRHRRRSGHGRLRRLPAGWHTCSSWSCYASHTKFRTGSRYMAFSAATGLQVLGRVSAVSPNPSIERTNSGLRPPLAAHVKR